MAKSRVVCCPRCGLKTRATPSICRSVHRFGTPWKCLCGQVLDAPEEPSDIPCVLPEREEGKFNPGYYDED